MANTPTIEVQPCRFVPVRHLHFITAPNPELLNQQNQRTCWHPKGIPKVDRVHRAERNMRWMERFNGCHGTLVIKQHESDCKRGEWESQRTQALKIIEFQDSNPNLDTSGWAPHHLSKHDPWGFANLFVEVPEVGSEHVRNHVSSWNTHGKGLLLSTMLTRETTP